MNVQVEIVNAFIDGDRGGNPAGVVLGADELTRDQKLQVARQIGLSETAFVSGSRSATVKLEFFTPARQIAHCGHATIATFGLLKQMGKVGDGQLSKETIDGIREIFVRGDYVFMEQSAPDYTLIERGSALASAVYASIGIGELDLIAGLRPTIVNTGNAFLIVPLRARRTLAALRPDLPSVEKISEDLDLIGFYPYCRKTEMPRRHAGARMFAPRYGIAEESATGMAAGPLACFLHDRQNVQAEEFLIEQGWLMPMPSPSIILVRLKSDSNGIIKLMAGGRARVTSTRTAKI